MNPKVHFLEAIQLSEIEAVRAFFVEYEGTLPFDPGYQVFDDEISGVSGPLGEPFIWRRLTACRSVPKDSAGPHRMCLFLGSFSSNVQRKIVESVKND